MQTPWHVVMLGGLRVHPGPDDPPVVTRFRTLKTAALLAYLAYHRQRPSYSREELIGLLWPDAGLEEGRISLRTALSSLRRQLEPPGVPMHSILVADRVNVGLDRRAVTTDVAAFEEALAAARRAAGTPEETGFLRAAVAAYGGPLLPALYDDWVLTARGRLEEAYVDALGRLVAALEREGDAVSALECARRAVAVDPLREEGHRDLMRLLAESGQRDAALRQFDELKRLLQEAMGDTPSPETRALAARITRGEVTQVAAASAPIASGLAEFPASQPTEGKGSLPLALNRFFGRDEEMGRIADLLCTSEVRLVTLTGTGGTGKTRLAMEAAARLRADWPGGVWFVPLAEVREAERIPEVVRDTLRVPRAAGDPLAQVVEALSAAPATLLILDNFEHLAAGGASVVLALLMRIPCLNCLVTSRQRLALPGERVLPVAPLPVPEAQMEVERLSHIASVRLFTDRAQASRPDFQVTARNAQAVATLCARLEGIPLALELAAAWSQVLSPAQMLERLEKRFDLLATRRTDKSERHRSLWAALAWSCDMLAPEVRRYFARLSVFRGGWTAEAAEAVCEEPRALDYLARLRERSLIVSEEADSGTIRFSMLETVREFAEALLEEDERSNARRRHAERFDALAQEADLHMRSPNANVWLDRLEADHDNLRAALAWCLAEGVADDDLARLGMDLGRRLSWLWTVRGNFREGRDWLDRLLALAGRLDTAGHSVSDGKRRYALLRSASTLALRMNDHAAARAYLDAAVAEAERRGDRRDLADVWNLIGLLAARQGDMDGARPLFEKALVLMKEHGDGGLGAVLNNLGNVAHFQGDYPAACRYYAECVDLRRSQGDFIHLAMALSNQGMAHFFQGDHAAARKCYREALELRRTYGLITDMADSLEAFASLAVEDGQPERAARLAGAAAILRRTHGTSQTEADAAEFAARMAQARAAIGEAAYHAAHATGEAMTLSEAIDFALLNQGDAK